MKKTESDIIAEAIRSFVDEAANSHVKESNGMLSGRPLGDWRATSSRLKMQPSEKFAHADGTAVKVPHKGQMVSGKVVRYDKGSGAESSFYVVDVGEYESLKVPAHEVKKLSESQLTESESTEVIAKKGKHTLSRITRKDGTGYYKLDDQWRADYPIHHDHIDKVAFDNPEYFPKPVVSWASDVVRKHAKSKKVSESYMQESVGDDFECKNCDQYGKRPTDSNLEIEHRRARVKEFEGLRHLPFYSPEQAKRLDMLKKLRVRDNKHAYNQGRRKKLPLDDI
jgi:hypothetical protein